MKNITLKQLRYMEALAEHEHFGRAAEASAISQPALSMQIRELEEALGLTLFERGGRQVRLTGFGETFVARARSILRAVDDLGELAQSAGAGLSARLRIGVIPTIAPYLLPAILGALVEARPGIDVHVRETLTDRLVQELGEGQLDAAVVALPIAEPAFDEVALFTEALLLVRPAEEQDLPVPRPDALRDMRLLMLEEGHCFRDQALSFCSLSTARPRKGLDGTSLSTLVQMVGAGIGVTLIPEIAVPVETRSAAVSVARFAAPEPTRTVGLVWRRSSPLAGELAEVAEVIREAAARVIAAANTATNAA